MQEMVPRERGPKGRKAREMAAKPLPLDIITSRSYSYRILSFKMLRP